MSEGVDGEIEEEHELATIDALLYVVIALLVGIFSRHALNKVPLPYTVLLLLWGIWIGVGQATYASDWLYLSPGITLWENINPDFFLALFLPILIFASGFALDWHVLRQVFWQAFLLAFPGVVFGAGLTSVLVYYIFPYNWTWTQCFMFGSMLSATDPVAVVAMLKEFGVDKRMRHVVDGEALFNDGSAYVLFLLFRDFVEGKTLSAGEVISQLVQLSLGGPAWGLAVGLAIIVWLRFVYNDALMEITLTIVAAFGCFIVGNIIFKVSGVLALVTLGIFMSAMGGRHISRKVTPSLHMVWEELEFMGNTVIFVLTGTIIATRVIESHVDNGITHIRAADYGWCVVLWLLLLAVRFLMFVVLYPLLRVTGYGITWKHILLYTWAGLRGAVGLALALFTFFDTQIDNYEYRVLSFFHMGMVAALTILVQGSTTGFLLRMLGFSKPESVKRGFLKQVLHRVEEQSDAKLRSVPQDDLLGDPNYALIDHSTLLDVDSVLKRYGSFLTRTASSLFDPSWVSRPSAAGASVSRVTTQPQTRSRSDEQKAELVQATRSRFLNVVLSSYEHAFYNSHLTSGQIYALKDSTDKALDRVNHALCDWKILERRLDGNWKFNILKPLQNVPYGKRVWQHMLYSTLSQQCRLAVAFVYAHQDAGRLMQHYDLQDSEMPGASIPHRLDSMMDTLNKAVLHKVLGESQAQCDCATQYIKHIAAAYPDILSNIKTQQVARELLNFKEEYLEQMAHAGLLDETEEVELVALVEKRQKTMALSPPHMASRTAKELLMSHPMLKELPPQVFHDQVMHLSRLRLYSPGSVLPTRDDVVSIVLRGVLKMSAPERTERVVAVTAEAVLQLRNVLKWGVKGVTMTADSFALVVDIPAEKLKVVLSRHMSCSQIASLHCAAQLLVLSDLPQFSECSLNDAVFCIEATSLKSVPQGSSWRAMRPALLVSGVMHAVEDTAQQITAPHELSGDDTKYTAERDCKLLLFSGDTNFTQQSYNRLSRLDSSAVSGPPPSRIPHDGAMVDPVEPLRGLGWGLREGSARPTTPDGTSEITGLLGTDDDSSGPGGPSRRREGLKRLMTM